MAKSEDIRVIPDQLLSYLSSHDMFAPEAKEEIMDLLSKPPNLTYEGVYHPALHTRPQLGKPIEERREFIRQD